MLYQIKIEGSVEHMNHQQHGTRHISATATADKSSAIIHWHWQVSE